MNELQEGVLESACHGFQLMLGAPEPLFKNSNPDCYDQEKMQCRNTCAQKHGIAKGPMFTEKLN